MCQGIDMIIMPKNHSHNCAALLRHSMCAAAAVAAAPAPAPPMPEPLQPVAHIDLESHDGEPELPMAQHVTAPVSHHGDYAMDDEPSEGRVHLSAEARDMAQRLKISETDYAAGKLKLARMKKSKLISE